MRIAYVSTDLGIPAFGAKGGSIHIQEVLRSFTQLGHQVHLLTPRPGDGPAVDGVTVSRLEVEPPAANRLSRERRSVRLNHAVTRALAELEDLDLIYERYALWSFAAMRYAARAGIPGLLEVNAPLLVEQQQYRSLRHPAVAARVSRACWDAAQGLLAVSRGVADYLLGFRENRGKVHVIPNGVRVERFAPQPLDQRAPAAAVGERFAAEKSDGTTRPFTIGFVGSLKPWHGVDDLLAAFAGAADRLGDARLLIVGDGPMRERLETQLAALPQSIARRIQLAGSVPPEAIPAQLAQMDVGVAPYPPLRDFYFCPLKVLEYLAAGLPVVASAQGDVPQLVADGRTGRLYPPGDRDRLAAALVELAHASAAQRYRMGAVGRLFVSQNHTWQATARKILALGSRRPATLASPGLSAKGSC